MKIAVLLLVHKNVEQIGMLVSALKHPDVSVFIHADLKMQDACRSLCGEGVYILPDPLRVDVVWARYGMVEATNNLLRFATDKGHFDYFWLCSGQDFPIKPISEIVEQLSENPNCNYLNFFDSNNCKLGHTNHYDKRNQIPFPDWLISRKTWIRVLKRAYIEITGGYDRTFPMFTRKGYSDWKWYFGSSWWCLTSQTIVWILDYLTEHPEYERYYQKCANPDESFYQTLVMASPYAEGIKDYLHYVDWSEGNNSPRTLTSEDIPRLLTSEMLMARKFDIAVDKDVLDGLAERCRR